VLDLEGEEAKKEKRRGNEEENYTSQRTGKGTDPFSKVNFNSDD